MIEQARRIIRLTKEHLTKEGAMGKKMKKKPMSREAGVGVKLRGGPFDGQSAVLSGEARRITSRFSSGGQCGRYVNGNWVAHEEKP